MNSSAPWPAAATWSSVRGFATGAIVLDEVQRVADLPIGWTDEQEAATYRMHRGDERSLFAYAVGPQSPRRYLSPAAEDAVVGAANRGRVRVRTTTWPSRRAYAFVGVRACELAAIAVQDRVLARRAASRPGVRPGAGAGLLRRRQLRQPGGDVLLHVDGHRARGRGGPRPRR